MSQNISDAISRSDRVLVAAMAIILATASAAIGASLTYHPSTDKVVAAVQTSPKPVLVQAPTIAPDSVMTQLLAEHRCLSEVLYYEARGEGPGGQKAIAEVVFHRMKRGDYGHSICAVVYEGKGRPGCQFSFTCNGQINRPKQMADWRQSEKLAAQILTGQVPLRNATGGALNYHAVSVSPDWADTMDKTTQIGNHIFYRNTPHMRDS